MEVLGRGEVQLCVEQMLIMDDIVQKLDLTLFSASWDPNKPQEPTPGVIISAGRGSATD